MGPFAGLVAGLGLDDIRGGFGGFAMGQTYDRFFNFPSIRSKNFQNAKILYHILLHVVPVYGTVKSTLLTEHQRFKCFSSPIYMYFITTDKIDQGRVGRTE